MRPLWLLVCTFLLLPAMSGVAQVSKRHSRSAAAASALEKMNQRTESNPLQLLGIRPGISLDSLRTVARVAGVALREVKEDTLSRTYGGAPLKVYLLDSVFCRLTYMRFAVLIDGASRVRRLTITPRESSIMDGLNDDIDPALLLYFGQGWGKPEIELAPPVPTFRWRDGNIQVRGFIRRGFPMWVMEG